MPDEKTAQDIGGEIASLLMEWRPEMDSQDVASAIMSALEQSSIKLEGGSEGRLLGWLNVLEEAVQRRRTGI